MKSSQSSYLSYLSNNFRYLRHRSPLRICRVLCHPGFSLTWPKPRRPRGFSIAGPSAVTADCVVNDAFENHRLGCAAGHLDVVRSPAYPRSSDNSTSVSRPAATHFFNIDRPTPKSSANRRRITPPVNAILTASLRNPSPLPVPKVRLPSPKPDWAATARSKGRPRDQRWSGHRR